MKRNESVTHIMSKALLTAHEGMKLSEVHHLLQEHRIHHVPVVSGKKFVGMITANDLLRLSYGDPYKQDPRTTDALLDTQSIREAMQEDIKTIAPGATVREAAEILSTGGFHGLPVVDEHGELVGLVTTVDLLRYFVAQY
jgi:CBS domain-containing protein